MQLLSGQVSSTLIKFMMSKSSALAQTLNLGRARAPSLVSSAPVSSRLVSSRLLSSFLISSRLVLSPRFAKQYLSCCYPWTGVKVDERPWMTDPPLSPPQLRLPHVRRCPCHPSA